MPRLRTQSHCNICVFHSLPSLYDTRVLINRPTWRKNEQLDELCVDCTLIIIEIRDKRISSQALHFFFSFIKQYLVRRF
ncbi:hypothetical protein E2C01_012637 [Portunus trituberculatus]|uniref:Uncharacterized protein n=1 Tax=Portunus trituberculatus TaxID=210409 RepID=A0A5B7DE86_PORTR|nr:hypothetical protein [Portunus trituberculatus]